MGRDYDYHEPLSLPLYSISHIEQIVQPAKHTFSKLQFLIFPLDVQESWARYCHLPRGFLYINCMWSLKTVGLLTFLRGWYPLPDNSSSSNGYSLSLQGSGKSLVVIWGNPFKRKCGGSGILNIWVLTFCRQVLSTPHAPTCPYIIFSFQSC